MGIFSQEAAALYSAGLADAPGVSAESVTFGRTTNIKKIIADGEVKVDPTAFDRFQQAAFFSMKEVSLNDHSMFWASDPNLFVTDLHSDTPKKLKANQYIKVMNTAAANSSVEIIDGSIQGGATSIIVGSEGAALVPAYQILMTLRDKNFAAPSLTVASWRWGIKDDSFDDGESVYDRLTFVSDDLFRLKPTGCFCERGLFIYQPSFESRNDTLKTDSSIISAGGGGTPFPLLRTGMLMFKNSPQNYKSILPDLFEPSGDSPAPLVLTFTVPNGPTAASFRLMFGPNQIAPFTSSGGATNFNEALAFLTFIASTLGAGITSNLAAFSITLRIPYPYILKVIDLVACTVSAARISWIERYRTHENMLQFLDLRILPIGGRMFDFGDQGLAYDFDIRLGTPISEVGQFAIAQNFKLLASQLAGRVG
jgi:hypothetical protein